MLKENGIFGKEKAIFLVKEKFGKMGEKMVQNWNIPGPNLLQVITSLLPLPHIKINFSKTSTTETRQNKSRMWETQPIKNKLTSLKT